MDGINMTIEDFGKQIKTKYPQYADIPDAELGQKMVEKYPQYQQQISKPSTIKQPEEIGGFLSGHPILKMVSDAIGTTGLVKGAAQGIFFNFTPEGKSLLKQVSEGHIPWSEVENILGPIATNKEVLGSAGETLATVATAGLPIPKGGSAISRIAKGAGSLGGVSALGSAAKSYGQGDTTPEVATSAATGGAFGATLGAAGGALAELGKLLTSSRVTEGIYNRAIGIPKKVVEKGKSPSKMLISEGISGTKKGILGKAENIAKKSDKQIAEILKSNKETFDSRDIIEKIRLSIGNKFQNSLSTKEISSIIDNLPLEALRKDKTISAQTLNALRKEIDNNFLSSSKWLNNSTSERINGLKTAANVMRELIQGSDANLPAIFSKYSDAITTIRALNSELAKPHILSNLLEIIASGGIGALGGGVSPTGIANAATAYGVYKGLTSTPLKTGVAKTLSSVGKASVAKDAIKTASKVATQITSKKLVKPSKKTK